MCSIHSTMFIILYTVYYAKSSVLHRAGPPASGWQLSARTCNFVTSRPYWPATLCLVAMSTTMSIWTRVVTCHRLDGSIVFRVDGRNLPSTNLIGSLKGAIFPRPVGRPTPGYRFYIQSICVSMACNEQAVFLFYGLNIRRHCLYTV